MKVNPDSVNFKSSRAPVWRPLVMAALVLFATAQAAEVEQTDVQLEVVRNAIAAVQDWINDASNSRSQLENELRAANRDIEQLQKDIAAGQQQLRESRAALDELYSTSRHLEEDRLEQLELVSQAVRASYMLGRDSTLKLVLNQEDPGPASRMLRYYAAFNESRLAHIQTFQHILDELEINSRDIRSTALQLEERNTALELQLAALARVSSERTQILADLEAELVARRGELEALQQDQEHLEELIDEINRIVADIPPPQESTPFAQDRGKLPWPVAGTLSARFGERYSEGNLQRQGVIISTAEGEPVQAVHAGRIVFADWLRGSGLLIVIDHGDGYMSLYAHNEALLKNNGDRISRGDIIAAAGSDAGTGSPGIYFEIRHNGQAQNPVNWCVGR